MRLFVCRAAIVVTLLIAGTLALTSALQDSQTYDEGVHLVSGYSYWKTGDFRLSPEHPPFSKLIATLPLLWLQPVFEPSPEDWQRADPWPLGKAFLYSNRIPADRIIMAGRIPIILMYLILAASIAWWVGKTANKTAGLAALLMFAFEPTVLAHSRYVTTDMPVTLFIWLAWISWCLYLERGNNWLLVTTSVLTGLAFASKFNALFLPVAFALTWTRTSGIKWSKIPAIAGIAVFVALATYGFNTRSIAEDPTLISQLKARPPAGSLEQKALQLPVPGYYFLRGIHMLLRQQIGGYPTYFLGEIAPRGSWRYFPAALLVKSSIGWLLLLLLAVVIAVKAKTSRLFRLFAVPALVYFAFTLASSFNIGIRHLLPAYPFLCAFAATAVFYISQRSLIRGVGAALLVVLLIESGTAYPNYLSFFNAASGGTENGHRYLADSNLDWGQDLKRLEHYISANNIDKVCLSYFGTADPAAYRIPYQALSPLRHMEDVNQLDCIAVVSVQHLYATKGMPFEALQQVTPTARVGASILVYDLKHQAALDTDQH